MNPLVSLAKNIWTKSALFIVSLLTILALKFRGDKYKASADKSEAEKKQYKDIVDDVYVAKKASDRLESDTDYYNELRDKYTRK